MSHANDGPVIGLAGPVWIEPEADLREAANRMAHFGTSSILVGHPGELVSILTERDIARAVARALPDTTAAGDLAVARPFTVDIDETIEDAGHRMLACGVRHLVVTRGNQAVGVLSMRDVLRYILATPDCAVGILVAGAPESRPEHWWG